jgi:hypothetical protein
LSKALKANKTFGNLKVKGMIEVPNEAIRERVLKALNKAEVNNIDVRVRNY